MISKLSFRDQVKTILRNKMFEGHLQEGERISLAELARELDVSVTPIREALTQLVGMDIVAYVLNRGFFMPELKMEVAVDIYPLISNIECFLLASSTITKQLLMKLKVQQEMFKSVESPRDVVIADMRFHEVLLSEAKNDIAKQLLIDLKTRIFFYEVSYMMNSEINQYSSLRHEEILMHLNREELDKAVDALAMNWNESFNNSRVFLSQQ